ncbi:ABC transporter permease [Actinophytocola gossypii]|uniref:Transport permease protein n=1 Tax=Actinophytocola gossypii TaxID=2812003 RepID=A0ABT2J4X2_9PSEU|nr:ABC transporter permease [Actinophytocola gossypii]MCT2582912.1 ABC transporter permease [Actinophytocola gossypii]
MTTMSYAARDSVTMLRRNLRHMRRYPSLTLMLLGQPLVFLLLFVYVFGGTLGDGLGGAGGRAEYVGYVTPAILLITVASAALGTAVSVAMDMTEGIIARFRTMAISRASMLTGHVVGTVIQTVLGLVVVTGVALAVGFSPTAGFGEWAAAAGVLLLLTVALTWMSVALGLVAKSVETASNTPMVFLLLPFLGSGFVPAESMPTALRWFAEYQPFTPVVETVRGLLLGTPIGNSGWLAIGWCLLIGGVGYLWSKSLFARERNR